MVRLFTARRRDNLTYTRSSDLPAFLAPTCNRNSGKQIGVFGELTHANLRPLVLQSRACGAPQDPM
jgi:hypothetical protein